MSMFGLMRLAAGLLAVWGGYIFFRRRGKGRRRSWLFSIASILTGALLLFLAMNPEGIYAISQLEYLTRIRLLMAVFSSVVLIVTTEAIRISRLRERYAILWIVTGLLILAGAIFTHILDFFCAALGMQYITLIAAIVFCFLILVAFQFSIELSSLHEDRAQIAQSLALLKAELQELKAQQSKEAEKPPTPPPSEKPPTSDPQ